MKLDVNAVRVAAELEKKAGEPIGLWSDPVDAVDMSGTRGV